MKRFLESGFFRWRDSMLGRIRFVTPANCLVQMVLWAGLLYLALGLTLHGLAVVSIVRRLALFGLTLLSGYMLCSLKQVARPQVPTVVVAMTGLLELGIAAAPLPAIYMAIPVLVAGTLVIWASKAE